MSVEALNNTMKKHKILFVIDSLGTGGAERDLAEELPQLPRFHIAPIVVSLRPREEGVQASLQRQGFNVRIFRSQRFPGLLLALRKIIRTERPDVIQTVLFRSDIVGRVAGVGTVSKVVSRLVNADYDKIRFHDPTIRAMRVWLARLIDGWTARHLTHHIFANSHTVKAAAIRDLSIPAGKITVIKQGRDSIRLGRPGAQRRKQARIRLGIDEEQEVLINGDRQDYQNGQQSLLMAMEPLVANHPRLLMLVAGRAGNISDELEGLRDRLGLKDRVWLLGHREDVPELLAASDLFVFPFFYEGLPGAVIEAMVLGLPIAASNIEPVRETVEEGRNAFLVKPGFPGELASAIERVLEDHQMAKVFGQRSREIFEERFTLERTTVRLEEFYQKVLSLK